MLHKNKNLNLQMSKRIMWFREYRDYKIDGPIIKQQVEPGRGIIGCEMHEIQGWGNTIHFESQKKKRGFFEKLFSKFFGRKT